MMYSLGQDTPGSVDFCGISSCGFLWGSPFVAKKNSMRMRAALTCGGQKDRVESVVRKTLAHQSNSSILF